MLPIEEIYPPLKAHLNSNGTAIIIAPPGAGKTTGVPLALLHEGWLKDQTIILLEPRRLAARAAAQRMAQTLGEGVGETVGYRIRGEAKTSKRTRIEVVTEGIFSRRIVDDPGLEGVGCVIFDEFHERSLDADLGLAFARDSQTLLREDLRILVMSATLDGQRLKTVLEDAHLFISEGRAFDVSTHYVGRDQSLRLEDNMAKVILKAAKSMIPEAAETLLAFLPGQGEIHRVASILAEKKLPDHTDLYKLYGAMDSQDQIEVLKPNQAGRPKIVLSTAIAETSLTLDRVAIVVDSGVSRLGRFDPARGMMRFVTERVSKASADQRRGRAGRTQVGVCYRLWDQENDRALVSFAKPEILETDLSQLVLDLRLWGAKSTEGLALLDHPPKVAMAEAEKLLIRLGALDTQSDITPHGRHIAALPVSPRLSHMLVCAAREGQSDLGAKLAVLLSEKGLGGHATDLEARLTAIAHERSPKIIKARKLAEGWARLAVDLTKTSGPHVKTTKSAALLLAYVYPERIAQATQKPGEFVMNNGRGVYLEGYDPLAKASFLAVGDLGGGTGRDRILLAAPLSEADILGHFTDQITDHIVLDRSPSGGFKAIKQKRFGELILQNQLLTGVPPDLLIQAESEEIRTKGLKALALSEAAFNLCSRVNFLREIEASWPDMSDEALLMNLSDWLGPYAAGKSLLKLQASDIVVALKAMLSHEQLKTLNTLAPETLCLPSGSHIRIDYRAEGGPRLEVRVQELFGLKVHPVLGKDKIPLTLALLSPAYRPIQITQDIAKFWAGSWSEVKREMKGRYPRHVWPEDPANAQPTTRAKPKGT
jgi:ATP-dependent helicase HrpB